VRDTIGENPGARWPHGQQPGIGLTEPIYEPSMSSGPQS